ncbi:hypothetical protein F5884DRAFT_797189 [Xylogone sp. PMI_703]|nr:hypothetical protein F5884DRAFT_797189 [Xylogone sp. PMI_703]
MAIFTSLGHAPHTLILSCIALLLLRGADILVCYHELYGFVSCCKSTHLLLAFVSFREHRASPFIRWSCVFHRWWIGHTPQELPRGIACYRNVYTSSLDSMA